MRIPVFMNFRDQSIRRKLTLIMMLTSGIAVLLVCTVLLIHDILNLRESVAEDLEVLAQLVGANSSAAVVFGDRMAATETLAALDRQPHVLAAAIYDGSGDLYSEYVRAGTGVEIPEIAEEVRGYLMWGETIEMYRDIRLDGERIGTIYILSDTRKLQEHLSWYALIFSSVLVVSLFVAFLVGVRLQRLITVPILRLASTVRLISSQKNYSLRAQEEEGRDELSDLISGFNDMLSEIQQRDSELEDQRGNLEMIVARRTSQLETVNKELEKAMAKAESAAEKMTHQAYHDALTGLPNRTLLYDRMEVALARARRENRRIALMFIDLDRFKLINDSLGHEAGDILLCRVGERLSGCVREEDTIARLGGDEFMILLSSIQDISDSGRVAQEIIGVLAQPILSNGHELHITASVGISTYPEDGSDITTLARNADISMYRAKERGRNNYQYYSAEMDAESHRTLQIETMLRKALERDELSLVYQPQVNAEDQSIIGAEALLRWNNPELGEVSPLEFIPIAEETGLITTIGEWVLSEACQQVRTWHDKGFPKMRMAVNLSARQFHNQYLVESVRAIAREAGVDPSCLEMEITESAVMHNTDSAIDLMKELRAMGVTIAIDDFGTGYSSLNYLRRFPIHTVKIDRSFVRELPKNEEDASIATAIIAMGHSLKLSVLAEGVEEASQVQFLTELGCDSFQGYYFGRPMTGDKFLAFLRDRAPRSLREVVRQAGRPPG